MKYLIDTYGWIEWVTDGKLACQFEPFFRNLKQVFVPTLVQFELYRWVEREVTAQPPLGIKSN